MNCVDATYQRPWLTAEQQVEHLKSKGVRFELMDEIAAAEYLTSANTHFRLRSYRANFNTVDAGPRAGHYINLDFKMLVALAEIDARLREAMLPMTLDIEHAAKLRLLQAIEQHGEDGYAIVQDFLESKDSVDAQGTPRNKVKQEIKRGANCAYTAGLVKKHADFNYPVWAFFEVVSFGTFLELYRFCAERFSDKRLKSDYFLMQNVKALRNACAHNNCILNDMKPSSHPAHSARYELVSALSTIPGLSASTRHTRLRNERFLQISSALYLHKEWIFGDLRRRRSAGLQSLVKEMNASASLFATNRHVTAGFKFIGTLVDAWYKRP